MKFDFENFDTIVVGGGHAGTEAALASGRMGTKTLLLTQSIDAIGQLSCNPSIGGIGKGHLVKEIDALGGVMGVVADQSGIHFKTLNSSKGPAVRATRAQIDRDQYKKQIQAILFKEPNITVMQQQVKDLWIEQGRLLGVITQLDLKIPEKNKIIAAMTQCLARIEKDRGHTCAPLPRAIKDIEQIIIKDNEWVDVIDNNKDCSLEKLTPVSISGTLQIPIGRLRKMNMGKQYLSAFTVGDQLLWGAAEPLRRMLQIILNK